MGMKITLRSGKHVNNIKATSMYKVIQSDHVTLKHNLVRYKTHNNSIMFYATRSRACTCHKMIAGLPKLYNTVSCLRKLKKVVGGANS